MTDDYDPHEVFPKKARNDRENVKRDQPTPRPKAFDPFSGKLPTTGEAAEELARLYKLAESAAEELARLYKLAESAAERAKRADDEQNQLQDQIADYLKPLLERGVLKSFSTHPVEGGFLTFFGHAPNIQMVFCKG